MTNNPIHLLLVEDNPGDVRLVSEMLAEDKRQRFVLHVADRLEAAMAVIKEQDLTVILLDLQLPDGSGLDTLLKIHASTPEIPIVVLSSIGDEALAISAVQHGAQDFLVKNHISAHLLIRALHYAIERKRLEDRLHYFAHHDSLTGLANRKHLYDRLKNAMAWSRRNESQIALLLIDLNGFKPINDIFGHHVGDQLLCQVADRLRECVRETDFIARMGGDEFVLILHDVRGVDDVMAVTQKLLSYMESPYTVHDRMLHVHVSLGISIYPNDADSMEDLLRNADVAMYQAKTESGAHSASRFYSPTMNIEAGESSGLRGQLYRALEQQEFLINYQPQVDIASGRMIGMEALLRWEHPQRGLLLPGHFMHALESTDLILAVGEWVLGEVCNQGQAWQEECVEPFTLSVNLASRQLLQHNFVDIVDKALARSGLPPHLLELEVPESALIDNEDRALLVLNRLHQLGVRLALDNFGSGRASFRYLCKFPFDSIKLDRSMVEDASASEEGANFARAVIQVAHVFKMKGLAEGVETAEQLDLLRSLSCDDAQGYLYSRPLVAAAASELLRRGGKVDAMFAGEV
jgi:diguanylate cyclase (GGDEF)-like protein